MQHTEADHVAVALPELRIMDILTAFGFFAVCLCLLFYAIQGFGRWTLIGFAIAGIMSSF